MSFVQFLEDCHCSAQLQRFHKVELDRIWVGYLEIPYKITDQSNKVKELASTIKPNKT
jgi:hypothetical protein